MDTVVLKFGGSSVADTIKLNIVADKIIAFQKKKNRVVVVVSAQGKTTDTLLKEAKELAAIPNERELDALVSSGEQVSSSKLAILLNRLGYPAISLTGWQAGIQTTMENQNAKISEIYTGRIEQELEKGKIVIIAGFQGINEKADITTLGRGGSDTTAVAVAAALKAEHCYIFSDVDGVYSTDPNKVTVAKKLESLSYTEMLEISNEGAKVLHNRSVEVAEKFGIPIITKSTFNNKHGTIVQEKIEDTSVKSIVKNDDLFLIQLKYEANTPEMFLDVYQKLVKETIHMNHIVNHSTHQFDISFIIPVNDFTKLQQILEEDFSMFTTSFTNVSRIAIVGHGIMNDKTVLEKTCKLLAVNQLKVQSIETNTTKIAIIFNEKLPNSVLEQLHRELI